MSSIERILLRVAFVALIAIVLGGCASPGIPPEMRSTRSSEIPWVDVRSALGYNWSDAVARMPEEVDRIDRVLRNRAVYRREGIGFGHLMLGPGGLYPYHSHASPEAYHVLSGEAEWSVDGETRRVGPGTTIYHAPYADHRWITTSREPLRVVWAQWVPDGDRTGLVADGLTRRGGSMTGDFFRGERRSVSILPTRLAAPVGRAMPGSVVDEMRRKRLEARTVEPTRPPIRAFVDSVGVPWNTELEGVRWRAVFGTPDLEWGHVEVFGRGVRDVPPSSAPGLLHFLSGRGSVSVAGGEAIEIGPGTTIAFWPGESIAFDRGEGAEDAWEDAPVRALWVRWAPDGDLGYWARDYFLVEPMPEPPEGASLARDVPFFE